MADLKPYFDDDHLENLRSNSLQGKDDVFVEGHDPKSKDIQGVLHAMRVYQEGSGLPLPGHIIKSSNFLTLVA